ncbi:GNAT family N-acetyltransferase [Candidatus Woesearchaeota archaeon]|nr:GNAT family N-acetyltransferase [Candidatus Woesearchaeota archaeon]MCF7901064.1 GNAT family N-acetyltransferase [Candidatus Woesearchaeota archaeon]MCF8013615.1 GNAT family N-acetyltransferase [Candidatus Woesearchaeota archaeon]
MQIRNANNKDIPQIINLWKKTKLYFEHFDKKDRLEEKIDKEPDLFLVAEEDNKVVGAVIGNYGWRVSIDHWVVSQKYQGKGIGKNLLSKIKNNLKQKGAEIALIDTNLPEAHTKKLGFEYRGNNNNYTIKL